MPDHSSLTRIRERSGLEVFRHFFAAIVEQCLAAGMVWGQELSIDATKVAATASLASLQPRFAVEAHLARLFATEADTDDDGRRQGPDRIDAGDEPKRLPVVLTQAAQAELATCAAARHDWIGQAGRPDRAATSGTYRRTADVRVSTTDPDATPMPYGERGTHLGYQDHDLVDGGRARIILTALVTPAEVQEHQPALDLLWRARFRWQRRPRQITGDTKYGTVETIAAVERERIHASVPLSDVGQRAGMFGNQDFRHDAEADVSHCPGGQTLRFLSQSDATHRRMYQAPATACTTCARRAQGPTSPRGRRISRSRDETSLDRVRGEYATEPYAKAMRKRQVWVEPLCAEAKAWHGLRRFRWRGLARGNGEALLIAAGQNLKRLLRWRGWGRRPFPSGAAGIVLSAFPPLPALWP